MSDRLKDKVGLITGAAQGLGKEMAKVMLAEGANIVITDINESNLEEAAKELSCEKIVLDVTNENQWKSVISQIDKQFGSLNILVNNAGIGGGGDVEQTDIDSWHQVHSVNLDSVFLGCKYALPLMRDSGNGSIINISSMSGIVASHNMSAYNSSKAAALEELYADMLCEATIPDIDEIFIIDPFPESLINGSAYLQPRKTESKFTL